MIRRGRVREPTISRLALAWLLAHGERIVPILNTRRVRRIKAPPPA
jgi:aryl-alcohol dehydrogenase-like predicted oxidoreductase